jgi:hypothetical protein
MDVDRDLIPRQEGRWVVARKKEGPHKRPFMDTRLDELAQNL